MHQIISEDSKKIMDLQRQWTHKNRQDSSEKSQTIFLSIFGPVPNGITLD